MTKSEAAYAAVRDRILRGELAPGQVIQQRELAAALGVSTTPLREALRRLMTEGLVELDSHRDARITRLRPEESRDLLELRAALDPLAASLAAQRRTNDDLTELRAALAALEPLPAQPTLDQLRAHRRFHRAIHAAAHNDLLAATLESLWDKADRYRIGALAHGARAEHDVAGEHHRLVEAIAAGHAQAAAAIMRDHIGASLGAAEISAGQ